VEYTDIVVNLKFTTTCMVDCAYITQLKLQKNEGDITVQHIARISKL